MLHLLSLAKTLLRTISDTENSSWTDNCLELVVMDFQNDCKSSLNDTTLRIVPGDIAIGVCCAMGQVFLQACHHTYTDNHLFSLSNCHLLGDSWRLTLTPWCLVSGDAIWLQRIWAKLVQLMACCLMASLRLSGPMMSHCQLDPWEQTSVKVESKW